jgi:GNAT superfamily N-acetyltransferase
MEVRAYRPSDLAALSELLGEMGYPVSETGAGEHAARFVSHPGAALLVACSDGRVVRLVAYCLVPRLDNERLSCRITDLVVSKAMRRQGIGQALLATVDRAAREAGARRLDLSTGDWRADAHVFYEGAGFQDHARALVRRLR